MIEAESDTPRYKSKVTQCGEEIKSLPTEIDILCIQETHIKNIEDVPRKLFNMDWDHFQAISEDKYAGVSIAWKWWIPKPVNLLTTLWETFYDNINKNIPHTTKYEHLSILQGRLMILVFQFEELDIIIANLYASASASNEIRYLQISTSISILEDTSLSWSKRMPQNRKITTILLGDMNSCSNAMRRMAKDPPPTNLTVHKTSTKCPHNAMDKIDDVQQDGKFEHAKKYLRIQIPTYLTNTTCVENTLKKSLGIDHIYIMTRPIDPMHIPHVPTNITFWHGQPRRPRTGHDILTITLTRVWRPATNKKAKGRNAPYKRYPMWLFQDPIFMTLVAQHAINIKTKMEKKRAPIDTIFDEFYNNWIPTQATKYIKSRKTQIIRKSFAIKDPTNTRCKEQTKEILLEWEEIDPDPDPSSTYNESGIAAVRDSNGMVITNPKKILEHITSIFKTKFAKRPLYCERKPIMRETLNHAPTKISPHDTETLENVFTEVEIEESIKVMKPEAAPGFDGLPLILFSHPITKNIMLSILTITTNYAMTNGRFPQSLHLAIIRLIQKEGKDNTDILSGKRPIMLMTIPIRIIAKSISMRLAKHMLEWIRDNQRAYIKGRRIEYNTAILTIILQKCVDGAEMQEILKNLMILEVDFEAAFDSVDHDFVRFLLKAIGVGPRLVTIIMLILTKIQVSIIVNESKTEFFRINRGCPQGCAISGDIFILVLECLFILASSSPDKFGQGIPLIPNSPHKILDIEFADDVNIFATKSSNIIAWIDVLQTFKIPTGLGINPKKTKINLLGSNFWGNPTTDANGVKEKKEIEKELTSTLKVGIADDIKLVGITLSIRQYKNSTNIAQPTWDMKFKSLLPFARFTKFNISNKPILARIPLVNKVMAKIWYMIPTCTPDSKECMKIAGMIDLMLWGNTTPLVKRSIFTQQFPKPGGLNAPNSTNRIRSLNSMWIRKFALEELPPILQEYMMSITQRISSSTPLDPLTQIQNLKMNFSKQKFNNNPTNTFPTLHPVMKEKLSNEYGPMVMAISNYVFLHSLGILNDPTISTKKTYIALMKQNENTPESEQVPSGQTKWTSHITSLSCEKWSNIWTLLTLLKKKNQYYLHNGIYNILIRRYIIPKNGNHISCYYCPNEEWNAIHTIYTCPRIFFTWQALWKHQNQRMITLQDIITVDNFKYSKPFSLTRMQLVTLIFLNEILLWTNQHNQKEEVPELTKINEHTFTATMIEKIEEKIVYFKKIGIG